MGYRRDSSDKKWQETKRIVKERDKDTCRLCRCLNLMEAVLFNKKKNSLMNTLDPAHIIPVSENSTIMYEPCNIVLLNRYSHEMLDSFRDPIDGHNISKQEVNKWWVRILKTNKKQYEEFKNLIKNINTDFEVEEI